MSASEAIASLRTRIVVYLLRDGMANIFFSNLPLPRGGYSCRLSAKNFHTGMSMVWMLPTPVWTYVWTRRQVQGRVNVQGASTAALSTLYSASVDMAGVSMIFVHTLWNPGLDCGRACGGKNC